MFFQKLSLKKKLLDGVKLNFVKLKYIAATR
jgi:hypothetical protein